MISVWGAVLVFNLLIHFVAPLPQYQYQSPYYLHFPPIPYNQIEINGPVSSNNIPPWLLQQGNLAIQNQTNNQGLSQVLPTVGTLRVQLPNPPYGNQIAQGHVLNNGSVMYYLSGPWGGPRNLAPINNNYVDNSIVTTTPSNWQNIASVTPVANSGDFTTNRQQQTQQFSQFNPQQQFYQQFNSLQDSQFPQQLGQLQQDINNPQQQAQQQFNQGQQQVGNFNRDQGQPPQMETSSQSPNNGPVSWTQQGGWGWSAWDAWGPPPPVTTNPNSDGSSVAPGRGLLTRNRQQSTTVAPATTTNSSTTTNSIFAGATDSITKLRRIVSRIRDITREELGSQRRNATSRSLRRNSTARKTTTATATSK